jgi:hypothetical protein
MESCALLRVHCHLAEPEDKAITYCPLVGYTH